MADRIQQRRDTAARWTQYNPILLEGEVGYVTDNPNQYKIGDGVRSWNDLPLRGFDGTIVQTTGTSEDAVMSQKAVTEKVTELFYDLGTHLTKKTEDKNGTISGKYITINGNISDLASVSISKYKVKEGELYSIESANWNEGVARQYAIYNSDTVFDSSTVVKIGGQVGVDKNSAFVIPSNGKTLLVQNYTTKSKVYTDFTKEENETIINNTLSLNIKDFLTRQSGKYITISGNLSVLESVSLFKIPVSPNQIFKLKGSWSEGVARQYAIYNSDSVFNSSTLIEIGEQVNADYITRIVIPENGKTLLVQNYTSDTNVYISTDNDYLKKIIDSEINNVSKIKSNVFVDTAFDGLNESAKSQVLRAIKWLKIYGINSDKIIVKSLRYINYEGNYFSIVFSDLSLKDLFSFSTIITGTGKIKLAGNPDRYDKNTPIRLAEMEIDTTELKTLFGTFVDLKSPSEDDYAKYGIKTECSINEPVFESSLVNTSDIDAVRKAIRRVIIHRFDSTIKYVIRRFSYTDNLFTLGIGPVDNDMVSYLLQVNLTNEKKLKWVKTKNIEALIDFEALSTRSYSIDNTGINNYDTYGIDIEYNNNAQIIAYDERKLTYNGEPLKLLDCGIIDDMFYLSSGTKLFKVNTLRYNTYDDKKLELVCDFSTDNEKIVGIYSARQLNNGKLLVNVKVKSTTNTYETFYSDFYIVDTDGTMHKKFTGNTVWYNHGEAKTVKGGYWTNIWDYDAYEDKVFVLERAAQGIGGKAWYSPDCGETWYVIFNARPATNDGLYPIMMPKGWDADNGDFDRGVTGTATYPGSNFHLHGISYDRYRNQVIIVSGDATYLKGSYTAVWVCKNYHEAGLYPQQGDTPEGGTKSENKVKMLNCTWNRIGLYNDENSIGKNLQFVNTLVFKDKICFGSDCGGGGVNGIITNTYPLNIVGSNFKRELVLNADDENALTHCGSGIFKRSNMPYMWVFHREGTGFTPESKNDRKAFILTSYDGSNWIRSWEDDTLDEERNTKITWGSTVIGNSKEMYLRYSEDADIVREIQLVE